MFQVFVFIKALLALNVPVACGVFHLPFQQLGVH